MANILVSWIGATDLRAPEDSNKSGLGPIAQAVKWRNFDEITIISDYPNKQTTPYLRWLKELIPVKIDLRHTSLSNPTHFGEIYKVTSTIVAEKIKGFGSSANLSFHLSPGTPAMAAVWIILAKTRFPAELIESSKEKGVRVASVPFDISAEYIPDLLRSSDTKLKSMTACLPAEAPEFRDIIFRSNVMQCAIFKAQKVALRAIPVLIEGESGTGKELLARAIHMASPRKDRPFIAINCGAIPAELVESELFGHEKGAFTGATASKTGQFEAAHKGTLFLDEVGELPKEIQVKLLRTLQEGEVKRVGATKPKKIDIRVIAATNRNIIEEVSSGAFREDLFYRLAVATLKLPPLREREGDISLLIDKLLEKVNNEGSKETGQKHKKVSPSAKKLLLQHPWPGNIRELLNTLTRAVIWSYGEKISEDDIKEALLPVTASTYEKDGILNKPVNEGFDLQDVIKHVAVHYLKKGLEETHGNKTRTAELLGLPNYQTLTNWMKKYGLE